MLLTLLLTLLSVLTLLRCCSRCCDAAHVAPPHAAVSLGWQILAIVESSYTSLKAFDRHISSLLVEVGARRNSVDGASRGSRCGSVLKKMTTASKLSTALTRKNSQDFGQPGALPTNPIVV